MNKPLHEQEQPPMYMPPPQHYQAPTMPLAIPQDSADSKKKGRYIKIAFWASVAFFLLSNYRAYGIVDQLFMIVTQRANEIVSPDGSPTIRGYLFHVVAFFCVMLLLLFKFL